MLKIIIFSEPVSLAAGIAICIGMLGSFFMIVKKKLAMIAVIIRLATALEVGFTAGALKKSAALLQGYFFSCLIAGPPIRNASYPNNFTYCLALFQKKHTKLLS